MKKSVKKRNAMLELISVLKDRKKPCYFANDNDIKLLTELEELVKKHV